MTPAQAVLLAVGISLTEIAVIVCVALLLRRLRLRRIEKRWRAAYQTWDGRLTVLPNPCTCCPVHGQHAVAVPSATSAETP